MNLKTTSFFLFVLTFLILINPTSGVVYAFSNVNEITIGYFPNITHAPAIVGVSENIFSDTLQGIKIKTKIFPNGSLFMDALSTGQIDIGYVGPGPAINRFLQGANITALASASTGGTVLVTRKDFKYSSVKDLKGKIVATAALGCTHDLLFRQVLKNNNMATIRRGGSVDHRAQKPATMMGLFATNQLDAAMVSEPWAAILEDKLDARVVLNWNKVPWGGNLPATVLVSTNKFIKKNPELIKLFLKAHLKAVSFIKKNPDQTAEILQQAIKKITRQKLSITVINRSLSRTNMTAKLDSSVVQKLADLSSELGFIKGSSNLTGFIDTDYLKEVENADSK